jgi:hypothetical protein
MKTNLATSSSDASAPRASISRSLFWAQTRCWSLCLLVLALWAGVGIVGLWSPFLLDLTVFGLPSYSMPVIFTLLVLRNCYKDWRARLALNASGIDQWTKNGYAFEPDADHPDLFSCELENLSATLAVGKPRWFVTARKGLSIKVYAPASSAQRAAILLTSDMLTAGFTVEGRRTLLAHELAHVRLRGYLFDMLSASANIIAWSGLAVAALFLPAYWGWPLLLLALFVLLICWNASMLGDIVAALISRIHEGCADHMADIVEGPGSVAKVLVHMLRAQLNRAPEGKRVFFARRRQSGFWGMLRYFKGELLAEHPHDLARVAVSRAAKFGKSK